MMVQNRSILAKAGLIGGLIALTSFFHYQTEHVDIQRHILLRELYFLPIILSAFWFGIRGGAGASLLTTLFYLPFVLAHQEAGTGRLFGNITQIILFNVFGLLIGFLVERRKREQQRLLEAERLAAMGKAVSCVAHDLKSPLVSIGGVIRQLLRKTDDSMIAEKLRFIQRQVERLTAMTEDMLSFAKPMQLNCCRRPLSPLLEETIMMADEKGKQRRVTVVSDIPNDLPPLEFDHDRLQEALLNILDNALEANPDGKAVLLRCRSGGGCVTIDICDSGPGIPEKIREAIFAPFMTTRNKGTGLGLTIAARIIEAHDGSLTLVKTGKDGTEFRITLPFEGRRKP
ncbi:MAG: hypothetical protein Kow0089_07320 [Desulfobulbaceae bacterium]